LRLIGTTEYNNSLGLWKVISLARRAEKNPKFLPLGLTRRPEPLPVP